MSDYRMRENEFLANGNTLAKLRDNELLDRDGNTLLRIRDEEIQDRNGNTLAKVRGDDVLDRLGNRIARISEISRKIGDSRGGASIAAFWLQFMR